jgi:hypothetical protein
MDRKKISGVEDARAGLCASCIHARKVESEHGSRFYLCELSKSDPRFAKYPRLPVMECSGYRVKLVSCD